MGGERLRDMTGRQFGILTVIERGEAKTKGKNAYWVCVCECGNHVTRRGTDLGAGLTLSCGCHVGAMKSASINMPLDVSFFYYRGAVRTFEEIPELHGTHSPRERERCRARWARLGKPKVVGQDFFEKNPKPILVNFRFNGVFEDATLKQIAILCKQSHRWAHRRYHKLGCPSCSTEEEFLADCKKKINKRAKPGAARRAADAERKPNRNPGAGTWEVEHLNPQYFSGGTERGVRPTSVSTAASRYLPQLNY